MSISAARLAKMQAKVEALMPDSCIILDRTRVNDGAGGGTVTYTAVTGGTVACRVDPITNQSDMNALIAQRNQLRQAAQLTLPYDAPITLTSKIRYNGLDWEIIELVPGKSWSASQRAKIGRNG